MDLTNKDMGNHYWRHVHHDFTLHDVLKRIPKFETHHDGMEGGGEKVTICCQETTVYFSFAIDRESVSVPTVRVMCDV